MSVKCLTIIHPKDAGHGVRMANDTKFVFENGTELQGVTRCSVEYAVDNFVTATIDLAIAPQENIEAHPLLSFESVNAAALHYGFELVPLPSSILSNEQRLRRQRTVQRQMAKASEMMIANS